MRCALDGFALKDAQPPATNQTFRVLRGDEQDAVRSCNWAWSYCSPLQYEGQEEITTNDMLIVIDQGGFSTPLRDNPLRRFVAAPWRVVSGSMEPTLRAGDLVIAERVSSVMRGSKRRGDIIVFRGPKSRTLVKRIVAIAGEPCVAPCSCTGTPPYGRCWKDIHGASLNGCRCCFIVQVIVLKCAKGNYSLTAWRAVHRPPQIAPSAPRSSPSHMGTRRRWLQCCVLKQLRVSNRYDLV